MSYKIVAIVIAILVMVAFYFGIQRHEKAECYKLQQYAREHSGFFLAGWQKLQCDHYGIEIKVRESRIKWLPEKPHPYL